MRKPLILLAAVAVLYLLPALTLHLIYGPSYDPFGGENIWVPDDAGGWLTHGHPSDPMPAEASRQVPLALQYLPIFLPALLLALFTLTPLRRRLEDIPKPVSEPVEPNKVDEP